MGLDSSTVFANAGVLTYTPDGGSAQVVGYVEEGSIRVLIQNEWLPLTPEETGQSPLDYLNLGGPILVVALAWQWDAPTRNALAGGFISGSKLVFTTDDVGKKATALQFGTLGFVATNSLHVDWSAGRVVPLIAEQNPFEAEFTRSDVVKWAVTFACLPPTAGGQVFQIGVGA